MKSIYEEYYTILHKGFAKRFKIKLPLWDKNEFQTDMETKTDKNERKREFLFQCEKFRVNFTSTSCLLFQTIFTLMSFSERGLLLWS